MKNRRMTANVCFKKYNDCPYKECVKIFLLIVLRLIVMQSLSRSNYTSLRPLIFLTSSCDDHLSLSVLVQAQDVKRQLSLSDEHYVASKV
jgi:hypothetical protein